MRNYQKQKEIENVFLENGFSKEKFVVGTGKSYSKKRNKYRFEFDAKDRTQIHEKTAEYAVKYFADFDFYILWKVDCKTLPAEPSRRDVFSIEKGEAEKAFETKQAAKKGVGFEHRLKENVFVTDIDTLKSIIKKFQKRRNNHEKTIINNCDLCRCAVAVCLPFGHYCICGDVRHLRR